MSIGSKFEFCLLELLRCGREEGGADWGLGGATLGQVCRCLLILGGRGPASLLPRLVLPPYQTPMQAPFSEYGSQKNVFIRTFAAAQKSIATASALTGSHSALAGCTNTDEDNHWPT